MISSDIITNMFRQVKKARESMGVYHSKSDAFDIIQFILIIITIIVTTGIYFYSQKAEKAIDEKKDTNNPIIKDLQMKDDLERAIDKYGNIQDE